MSLTRPRPLLRDLKSRRAGASDLILILHAKQPNRMIGEKPPKASTPRPELPGDSLAIETVDPISCRSSFGRTTWPRRASPRRTDDFPPNLEQPAALRRGLITHELKRRTI